jgi:carboxylate-amine ligase
MMEGVFERSGPEPPFTIGVEEEFQIVDLGTRELKSHARRILPQAQREVGGSATGELFQSQLETGTSVCSGAQDVRDELVRLRRAVIEAAQASGDGIVAASTHPLSRWQDQEVTPKHRYLGLAQDFAQLAEEHLICGCHVHVGIGDREAGIQILNRARSCNSVLLALSGNSPFWQRRYTSYSSFRTEVWRRWPMAGSPLPFRDRAEYDALVQVLVRSGAISDESKIYWDIRPADRFETLEFRSCDIGTGIEDTLVMALLCRAVAQTCWRQWRSDVAQRRLFEPPRGELLRAAEWRAARYGVGGTLIDVESGEQASAREVVERLLEKLRPVLEERSEWELASGWAERVLREGNGAQQQRVCYERSGSLESVVDDLLARTRAGVA